MSDRQTQNYGDLIMDNDLHKHLRYLNSEDRREFHSKMVEAFQAINFMIAEEDGTSAQWVGRLNVAAEILFDMQDIATNYLEPGEREK